MKIVTITVYVVFIGKVCGGMENPLVDQNKWAAVLRKTDEVIVRPAYGISKLSSGAMASGDDNPYPKPDGVCKKTPQGYTGCTCPNGTVLYCEPTTKSSDVPEHCACGQHCSKDSECPPPSMGTAIPVCRAGACQLNCLGLRLCPADMKCIEDYEVVCEWYNG